MTTSIPAEPAGGEPARLLMVETQSPWQSNDSRDFLGLVGTLADAGSPVHLHLTQNAVLWLQHDAQALRSLRGRLGGRLLLSFDDVSLDLRGIPHAEAAQCGEVRGVDALVAEMADPAVKTIWHS